MCEAHRVVKLLLHDLAVLQELRLLILQTIRPILIVREQLRFLLLPHLHRCYRRRAMVDDGWNLLDHRLRSGRLMLLRLTCFGFLRFSI